MFALPTHHIHGTVLGFREKIIIWLKTPPLSVRTNFFRLLAVSQLVGIGLRESLISIAKSENNSVMQLVIDDMIQHISAGESLSLVLERHPSVFHTTEVELVRAAQTMGNLPAVLKELADEMESYQTVARKIQ